MMHENRPHSVTDVETIGELARKLSDHTWTACTGFRLGHLLFLNDATSPDGAQEYAVLEAEPDSDGLHVQVESLTASWMTREQLELVLQALYQESAPPEPQHVTLLGLPATVCASAGQLSAALGGSAAPRAMGRYALVKHPRGVCSRCA